MPSQPRFIRTGEVATSNDGTIYTTILGSCISVCLFHPRKQHGGITHCATSFHNEKERQSTQEDKCFRDCRESIKELLRQISKESSSPLHQYKAKIVGGSSAKGDQNSSYRIGRSNIDLTERVLRENGIEIIAKDVGGECGRKIYFYSGSGRLRVSTQQDKGTHQTQAPQTKKDKKSVFILDDSKVIQKILIKVLSTNSELEIVGVGSNPVDAEKDILETRPDVITLDINMPKMDGITFLKKFLKKRKVPIVLVSSLSLKDGGKVLEGLEHGAVDYIQKPTMNEITNKTEHICQTVLSAANIPSHMIAQKDPQTPKKILQSSSFSPQTVIAIGASTGGTEAIKSVLTRLPDNIPPIVIVQHIPPVFSKAFSDRVNSLCSFTVKEAESGDTLEPNKVLIAPGAKQMKIQKSGDKRVIKLTDDPPVNRHAPSVDYLFASVANHSSVDTIGVILTGMGEDGAKGLKKMSEAGMRTIAQSESSCVVFGMPKKAIEMGAVDEVKHLNNIPELLTKWWSQNQAA